VSATDRAKVIAGPHAERGYERTRDVLQRTVLERYEVAVGAGNLGELSELTPLLGMLDLAGKGVGLYLRYSQADLNKVIAKGLDSVEEAEEKQNVMKQEEEAGVRISRAEQRRREEVSQVPVTVCSKLAKVYNAAVTHLRHHLPMVAYALGEADGDAALVQLVHIQVEKRAVKIVKEYLAEKRLPSMQARANVVANQIEEKYISGNASLNEDLFSDMGISGTNGAGPDGTPANKNAALEMMDDCGFKSELGSLPQINSFMDELALLLQHTESYDRFIRHAIDEVDKARALRKSQKKRSPPPKTHTRTRKRRKRTDRRRTHQIRSRRKTPLGETKTTRNPTLSNTTRRSRIRSRGILLRTRTGPAPRIYATGIPQCELP